MKKLLLVLLTLLALIPGVQLLAQTPPVAAPPASSTVAPVPDVEQFLATLPDGKPQAPVDSVPAPLFMAGCTSNSQCPTGQLCCNACGISPDGGSCLRCVKPLRGHCPLVG